MCGAVEWGWEGGRRRGKCKGAPGKFECDRDVHYLHRGDSCTHISNLIKMCNLLYVNYTSGRIFKIKKFVKSSIKYIFLIKKKGIRNLVRWEDMVLTIFKSAPGCTASSHGQCPLPRAFLSCPLPWAGLTRMDPHITAESSPPPGSLPIHPLMSPSVVWWGMHHSA